MKPMQLPNVFWLIGRLLQVTISAAQDVLFGADGDITRSDVSASGLISILADQFDGTNTSGVITQVDGSVINGGGSTISLMADGDVTLATLTTTGEAYVTSTSGAIIDGMTSSEAANITASAAALRAATGIGSGAGDADIDTSVTALAANNSTSGDIQIDNSVAGILTIGTVDGLSGITNGGGSVAVNNASPIVVGQDVIATQSITLTAADSAAAGDDVTVSAGVTVEGTNGNLAINAGDSINASANAALTAGGNITLTADAGSMDVLGAIILVDTAVVSSTGAGNVDLSATGDVALSSVSTSGEVTIDSTTGSILDNGDDATDIIAATAVLTAAVMIGQTSGSGNESLETQLANLEASASAGGIYLDNQGNLIVGGVSGLDGLSSTDDLNVTTVGSLTVSEAVDSNGGNVTLGATTDIRANANVTSDGGSIVLNADTDQATSTGGGIVVTATIDSTGGPTDGEITLGGGSTPSTAAAIGTAVTTDGVSIDGGTLTSGTGTITVNGASSLGGGISVAATSQLQTTTGDITLTGSSTLATGDGVAVSGAGTSITTVDGRNHADRHCHDG